MQTYRTMVQWLLGQQPRESQNVVDVSQFPPRTSPRTGGMYFYDPAASGYKNIFPDLVVGLIREGLEARDRATGRDMKGAREDKLREIFGSVKPK